MGNRFVMMLILTMLVLVAFSVGDAAASFISKDLSDRSGYSVTGLLDQGRDLY